MSGQSHPCPPTRVCPRISPIAADPTRVHPIGANPRRGPAARTRGAEGQPPGRGSWGEGEGRGSPPLPWRQAGARQRSHGCRGRSAPWQQAQLATGPISACNYEGTQCLSSIRYHSVSAVGGQHLSSELHGTAGSRAGTAGRCRGISGNNHITQVLTFRLPFSLSLPPSLKSHLLPDCLRSPGWSGGGWQ